MILDILLSILLAAVITAAIFFLTDKRNHLPLNPDRHSTP